MKRNRGRSLLFLAAIAVSGLVACSNSKSNSKPAGLTVTQKEFSLTPSATQAGAGKVKVTVRNDGTVEHELVAFRTDLDEAKLPLTAAGDKIDEEGAGITHLDPEAEGVKPGSSKTITVDLPAGRYVFVCNLPAHYTSGMHAVVTVT